MYVPLQLYHYDLFILMWSMFLRVLFLEVLSHMVMWRGAPHTYQVCVWSLSLCRCAGARVRSKSRTNCVHVYYRSIYARQARGIWPMLVQCWAVSYLMAGQPGFGLVFRVLLGSLHNFTLFLTIYYSMLCFLDSVS